MEPVRSTPQTNPKVRQLKGREHMRLDTDRLRVLLTGGHGMVGQAVRRAASRSGLGWNIIAPQRRQVDLRDRDAVWHLFQESRFDLVIHCAARVGGIAANIEDPAGFLLDNLRLSLNVLEMARDVGVPRVINVGSSCMYPKDYPDLLREEDLLAAPLEPTNEGYALSKLVGAKLCEYISREGDYCYRTIIPCNLFGPGDEFSPDRSHLIAAAICKIQRALETGCDSVEIWGDGEARREFLFVDDLAGFLISIASRMDELPPYLNLGYGKDYTVNEYYRMVARQMGFEGSFTYDRSKPIGMHRKLLASTRAAQLFNWSPRTSVEEGIRQTVHHFRSEGSV
ncbi:MAG: GDP-L-fucose synthase [bacterium]|nr:GDP-L-fucose synthase [bacterium]